MSTSINIIPNDNVISVQDSNNQITITSNTSNVVVDVTQPITNTVQVLTGPQGQKGDQGPVGPSGSSANINTGSLATTGSNAFTGNQVISGSIYLKSGSVIDSIGADVIIKAGVGFNAGVALYNNNLTQYLAVDDTGSYANKLTVAVGVTSPSFTGSLLGTAATASYFVETDPIFTAKSASLATTGSNRFNGNITITGSLIQGLAGNIAIGDYSHAEGFNTRTGITTAYSASVVSGIITMSAVYGNVSGEFSANERVYLYDAPFDDEYGRGIFIISQSSFDGTNTTVELANDNSDSSKVYVLALSLSDNGNQTIPGIYSHTEGANTQAIGEYSHAEGGNSKALGNYSHAEGESIAVGAHSHAEGSSTQAIGAYSHAEGGGTKATGERSHAEGDYTQAIGDYSHAEGQETIASGSYSHAEGYQTIALANRQHVQGQWNATSSVESAFIVGNGTDDGNRSNLIHAAGNEVQISGSVGITNLLTLTPQHPLPSQPPTGSFAVSSSVPPRPFFWNGTSWNALY